ncbi:hypothetical protein LSH36_6g15064, partial [Paralvinella palmiformis]
MLYKGLDTGDSWSTVHFCIKSAPHGTSGRIHLKMISNSEGKVLIGGVQRFNITDTGSIDIDMRTLNRRLGHQKEQMLI